ncbi:MAG: hypothetical protein SOZ07_08090 [Prevotella sp.]|nr:hypothetical protein [Prevotellaceae bacterium]MDY3936590.1 hypothetical protein [Prevotella sp.]
MGRNKFSAQEVKEIGRLLELKNASNRAKQKLIRHELRVEYEFNISDFNVPGKAFGKAELEEAVKRGAIHILDDQTIETMKAKWLRDKARDKAIEEATAITQGEQTDWKAAMQEWEEWEKTQTTK